MKLRTAAILAALAANVCACSVPVFRYALDRWPADNFRLEIPATAPSPQRLADSLGADAAANIEIIRDAAGADAKDARLFLPHRDDRPVWSGRLDEAALKRLVTSPARTEITRRILGGDSAVWVLVESGRSDDDAAVTLEKRHRHLEQALSLPKIDPRDPTSKLGPGPALAVKFSVLRVRRDNPAEREFLLQLAGPKQFAADIAFIAPVFGRGHVLGAWPADALDAAQIDEAAQFLCGACSCEVKALNPGWDLLMDVDWDAKLAAFANGETPAAAAPVPPAVIAPAPVNAPAPPQKQSWLPWAIAAAALAAILSGIAAFRRRT